MDQKSSLISNLTLIKSSEEIFNYAEKIATENSLLTSDLILAAVWYCLNQAKQTSTNKTSVAEYGTDKDSLQVCKNHSAGKESDSFAAITTNNKTVSENEKDSLKQDSDEGANKRELDGESEVDAKKDNDVVFVDESDGNLEDIDKQQNSQSKDQNVTKDVQLKSCDSKVSKESDCPNEKKTNTTNLQERQDVCKIDPSSSSELKKDLSKMLEKSSKVYSESNTEEKDISLIGNVSDSNTICNKSNHKGKSPKTKEAVSEPVDSLKDKNKPGTPEKGKQEKENVPDVEIISIDDDDSNDVPDTLDEGSTTEVEKDASEKHEEPVEEKEPEYFDMDCDEIDDDNNCYEYEQMIDDRNQMAKEVGAKTDSCQNDADITIISDDEDDCNVKEIAAKASTSVDKGGCTNKTNNSSDLKKSQLQNSSSEKTIVSEGTRSRRKQSFANIKEDTPETTENITNIETDAGFSCTVVEHLDSVTIPEEQSPEKAVVTNSPSLSLLENAKSSVPSISVLGLVPVCNIQTYCNKVVGTGKGITSVQIFPNLATQSIYVSSGTEHGSIPSLPKVYHSSDPAITPDKKISAGSETFQYDHPDMQAQSSYNSQVPFLSTSAQSSSDEFGNTPRKKRLLDYDKKWHMEPKFSPEQDKYLALPGGVEGNSMTENWRHPGKYISVSQHIFPSIGIEKVDSDYANSLSVNDEHFFNEGNDDDYINENDHDGGNDNIGEDDKNRDKKETGKVARGRGRPKGSFKGSKGVKSKGSNHSGLREDGMCLKKRGRGRPRLNNAVDKGLKTSKASVKIGKSKTLSNSNSPSKFKTFGKGTKFTTREHKIGFYSLNSRKGKHGESPVKIGCREINKRDLGSSVKRSLHNNKVRTRSSVSKDDSKASSSKTQSSSRGKQSLKNRQVKTKEHKKAIKKDSKADEKDQENVIVID